MCVPGRSDSDASSYFAYNLETSRSLSALSPEHAKQLCETRNAAQNAKKN